jgi:hypothetical protein
MEDEVRRSALCGRSAAWTRNRTFPKTKTLDCFDGTEKLRRRSAALLDRLASQCVLRRPLAVYVDKDGGSDIAESLSKRIAQLTQHLSLYTPPQFVPLDRLELSWPDHVHAPYVTFVGPTLWERGRPFRKQLLGGINPVSGVRLAKSGASILEPGAMVRQLGGSGSGSTANSSLWPRGGGGDGVDEPERKSIPAPGPGGRRRRGTPVGLVDRSADVSFHQQLAVTTTATAGSSSSSAFASAVAAPLSVVGINVDAKLPFRAYPELRTPCGAGNSYRYRSVARCIVRRAFVSDASWTRGPLGDPLVSGGDGGAAPLKVEFPRLLLQERTVEYFCGRARPFQAVPVVTAKIGF